MVVVRWDVEDKLTTTHSEVIGSKSLDKFQLFMSIRIFLTLTDDIHFVDIRIQSLHLQFDIH